MTIDIDKAFESLQGVIKRINDDYLNSLEPHELLEYEAELENMPDLDLDE